jgi:hypothetical protein
LPKNAGEQTLKINKLPQLEEDKKLLEKGVGKDKGGEEEP